ncbi:MAG TPA: FAD-dependent monooxygenase [Candidatus Saccharimonadales bacterium]|nr:FAD-dependent monooxygenase [Candidatus Saccharimonadales bacterium]
MGFARVESALPLHELTSQLPDKTDVFVIGGGPAGLAVAIAAASKGLSVCVAEGARPPIDKACGEGIMPDGLAALTSLGISLDDVPMAPFYGIRFVDTAGEVSANFRDGVGFGVRRTELHSLLVKKAEEAGVTLLWGTRVDATGKHSVHIGECATRARYVIYANGQISNLHALPEFQISKVVRRRYGFRDHYAMRPWSPYVEVHWADCGQVYVTPVSENQVCVAYITSNSHERLSDVLCNFPEIERRLSGLAPISRTAGSVTTTRRLRAVCNESMALAGDASGSADAITGDGLSMSFRQAKVLAECIAAGDLQPYQNEHRRISRLPCAMGELMLIMHDRPWLRHKVFRAFSKNSKIFEMMLAMHTGTISPVQFGLRNSLEFGWSILTA